MFFRSHLRSGNSTNSPCRPEGRCLLSPALVQPRRPRAISDGPTWFCPLSLWQCMERRISGIMLESQRHSGIWRFHIFNVSLGSRIYDVYFSTGMGIQILFNGCKIPGVDVVLVKQLEAREIQRIVVWKVSCVVIERTFLERDYGILAFDLAQKSDFWVGV